MRVSYELLTLPLPFVLWFFTFRLPVFGFWATITLSSSILLAASLPRWGRLSFAPGLRQMSAGAIAAMSLYALLWSGYQVAKAIPGFTQSIASLYGLRGELGTTQMAEVLLFPIGPAEELYWRGMIQGYLAEVAGPTPGLIIASILYSLIHIPTLNPSLMLVALIGGLVWGYMFKRYGRILPVIFSHVIFDELIFVFLVIP